jgi:protein-S-isoprenylcysteine O-methyltransferase Ste14
MKRLVGTALFCAILAMLALATSTALLRHNWSALVMVGCMCVIGAAYVRLALENRRLKEQIRELETGLGL